MRTQAIFSAVMLACISATTPEAGAQTTINPDISVIPRFRLESTDGARLSEGQRRFSRPEFTFEELELVVASYLNPFAKAAVTMTLPGPDIEANKLGIEEVYAAVVRGLPLDLNLQFGKYRVGFGKLNLQHPHAWPFATQPLVAERFLGEEGLNDLGLTVSALLPTGDIATTLSVDVLRGGAIGDAVGIPDTSGGAPFYALAGRLSSFFPLSDESDLEVGLSGYTGIHDPYQRRRFWYGNLDWKFKWKPDMYTSLTIQGEVLVNTRAAARDRTFTPFLNANGVQAARTITSAGAYLYCDYQFLKIFSIGARFDWSEAPYSAADRARAVSIFIGYYPVEETLGLRLHLQNTRTSAPEAPARTVNLVALQALFSLGPHKAHPF